MWWCVKLIYKQIVIYRFIYPLSIYSTFTCLLPLKTIRSLISKTKQNDDKFFKRCFAILFKTLEINSKVQFHKLMNKNANHIKRRGD